ncbi:MAG: glycosyltransferase family 4 protein [Gemmatimonadales bacterium]|nr:glycosyltransferase family 4 protein [Gemmatimonadales bacterium]
MQAIVVSRAAADPAHRAVLKALVGLNWRVTAAVPHRWKRPGRQEPLLTATGEDGGVRIVPITVKTTRGGRPGGAERWDARALRRLFKDVRPDLVHLEAEPTTRVASAVTGMCRAGGLDIPTVLETWESLAPRRSRSLRERANRTRSLSRLSGLIAGSSHAAELIRAEYPRLPTIVIPDAARDIPSSIPARPEERFTIACAGRLIPERGVDLLFHACVTLPCSWSIRVIGTGPEQESLEHLAEQLGIASRVTWHGGLPHSARQVIWPEVDCIAVPSRRTADWVEAKTPLLLEAMSHGVAVVAADTGSLPEVIAEAGIVVPEGDVDSLTQALERLSVARLRHDLGRAARQRVMQHFSPTAIAKQMADGWTRFLGAA